MRKPKVAEDFVPIGQVETRAASLRRPDEVGERARVMRKIAQGARSARDGTLRPGEVRRRAKAAIRAFSARRFTGDA